MRRAAQVVAFPFTLLAGLVLALLAVPLMALSAVGSLVADRTFRVPRALLFFDAYVGFDCMAIGSCAVIWARRLRSRDTVAATNQAYAVMTRLLDRLYRAAEVLLDLHTAVDGDAAAVAEVTASARPVIVLSRHSGPGDSFLVAHRLLCMGRRLRIVLRAAMRFEPVIGLLATLLPLCFVRRGHSRSDATLERITALAAGMDSSAALLLFPEGGNVSEERMRRGITALLRAGMRRRARQAARLQHLAAPFPGGALAALHGAPHADVIFLAHSGLTPMDGVLWQRIPLHITLRMHLFLVAGDTIPESAGARSQWLFDWWQQLDAWIGAAA